MENILMILIGAIFVNNFVLARFLGLCPFFGVSRKTSDAVKMGFAVTFVITLSSFIIWLVYNLVLIPTKTEYLQIVVFILVIAFLVQIVGMFIRSRLPLLYKAFGIYLPLITTNCVVLAVVLLNTQNSYSLAASLVHGIGAGLGFMLALLIMSGIRERLEIADIPESLKGLPIAFITAAMLALAFMAFGGMLK